MINYYKELGINKSANLDEIKSAYVKQLKKYHPDVYEGDAGFAQEKTALLNECYNTLKDEKLRVEYDKKLFGNIGTSSQPKHKKENIFEEFTKNFRINLNVNKNQTKKSKKQKIKKTGYNPAKKENKFVTEEDLNKIDEKENKRLSLAIFIVIILIIICILLIII